MAEAVVEAAEVRAVGVDVAVVARAVVVARREAEAVVRVEVARAEVAGKVGAEVGTAAGRVAERAAVVRRLCSRRTRILTIRIQI